MPLLPPMQVSLENKKSTGFLFLVQGFIWIYLKSYLSYFITCIYCFINNVHQYAIQACAQHWVHHLYKQTRFCKVTIFLMNSELMPSCIIDIVVNDFVKPDFNETKHLGQENKMKIFFPWCLFLTLWYPFTKKDETRN